MATPFSVEAVSLLARLHIDAIKIASGDLTWDGLIARAAAVGVPLVISTGMASAAEAAHALKVARRAGAAQVALLHCVSAYPVPLGSENLAAIRTLGRRLRVPVGLSDHGHDTFAVPMAVALGACLYERHLVLQHGDESIDDAVSSTPEELASAIAAAARARAALGTGEKVCLPVEAANRAPSRRGLYVTRALPAGHILGPADLVALRPAHAGAAARLPEFLGRPLIRALSAGAPVLDGDVAVSVRGGDDRVVA